MRPQLDLILENADVVTMDPARPRATRVGVLFGRFVAFDDELDGARAEERIDLGGACVLPGFIDAHTHLQLTGQNLAAVDIGGCGTPDSALATIASAALTRDADAWIEVSGYNQNVIGRHLTAVELHRAGGGRRVWVRQVSAHASVVSTAVLDGIEDRAALGHRGIGAGLLEEVEQELVALQRLPYAMDETAALVEEAALAARRQGVTGVVEAGAGGAIGSLTGVDGAVFQRLLEQDRLPLRVQLMPSIDVLHGVRSSPADGFSRGIDLGLRTGFGSDRLGIAAQKIVMDGGMQMLTARMTEPFEGTHETGMWRQDPQEMIDATVDGHRAGWQMALHAIGDAAVDLAIDAFERAQQAFPRADARHRIEHGGAIRDDQIPRLARLGVTVVSQPSFLQDFGDHYADILGPERTRWLYRGRSLIERGVRVVGSTDRPLPGSPLRAVQALVDRRTSGGVVLAPEERIGVAEALKTITVRAAWLLGREDRLGRIARGHLADATVLEANPLEVGTAEIADLPVVGTLVDGRGWWA